MFFCGDQSLIDYVQMICGLCLIGKVYTEAMIIAYGDGRNGKSTFWNVIYKVLGSYSGNISADLVDGIKSLPDKIYSIGSDIVEGLWNGIGDMVGWLWDKISGFCDDIWDNIAGFFGIASPSKLFKEELGFNLVYGLAEGVDDKVKTAVRAVNAMGQDVMTAAQKSLNMSWNVGGLVPSTGSSVVNNYYNNDNSRTVNQTNNSPKALSRLEIYRLTRNAVK